MASSKILYCSALDLSGLLVQAKDAIGGQKYTCPVCSSPMSLKKGTKRRPHFSHRAKVSNCTGESVLHFSFKNLLAQRINSSIQNNVPIELTWSCKKCSQTHHGNLIRKAKTAILEHDLLTARPDISLIDENETVIAAIEVVVTHHPEKAVQEFYLTNNIALVQFNVSSEEQLNDVYLEVLQPALVSSCTAPKCPICSNPLTNRSIVFSYIDCEKCGSARMPQIFIDGTGDFYCGYRSKKNGFKGSFTEQELKLALKFGAQLRINQKHFSFSWDLMCPSCRLRIHPFE
jgi:ssDNA-binding Zn-finger/Zn-ribbon topoisomerase 1